MEDVNSAAKRSPLSVPLVPPVAAEQSQVSFKRVVLLCALVGFLDGFDTQSVGPAASAIAAELGIRLSALGPVFSASQIGFLVGALVFSTLGDRFGRKRALLLAIGIFAGCSLGTALAGSYPVLVACRALAGLGLGGATPNFVSLASEYSPPPKRARVVTMMWAAVPFGGMVASFASAAVMPALGWKAMFVLGCVAPLLLIPVLQALLPESHEIVAPGSLPGPGSVRKSLGHSVAELFTQKRAVATILLWLASFMTWMTLVVVAFWTPPLLQHAGLSAPSAAAVLALNNAGGVIGTVLIGAALGRTHPHRILLCAFLAAAVFIAAIGSSLASFALLACVAGLAGFFSSAAGGGIIALSASTYPPDVRATGVGWALGFGRMGSIVGPMSAGLLVAHEWPVAHIYGAMACPALLAAGLIALLARLPATQPHRD